MYSRQSNKIRTLLPLADLFLVWAALESAYFTRAALPLERQFHLDSTVYTLVLLFAMLTWVLIGSWTGTYSRLPSSGRTRTAVLSVRQSLAGAVVVVLFEYAKRLDLSRTFLGFFFVYVTVYLVLFRWGLFWLGPRIWRGYAAKRFVYIAGTGPSAQHIAGLLSASAIYGLHLSGFLDSHAGEVETGGKTYPVRPISQLAVLLRQEVVDEVVFTGTSDQLARWEDYLLLCDEEGVSTRLSIDFFPHVNSRIYLDRLAGLPLLTFAGAPQDDLRLLAKRIMDFLLAAAALLVISPLLLLVVCAIRATSRGPAIFRQTRCGLNGRRFTLYKFRTMVADAEARKSGLAHLNVKDTAFKIPDDPRITPLGRWLRKFSIDELPQLWNVVRGEMSLVGPRPPVPDEVENYERWQRRRLRMRPGLTCLWALAGRDQLSFDEWMRHDLAYIDSWSLALDWSIILRTIPHVLSGRGAH